MKALFIRLLIIAKIQKKYVMMPNKNGGMDREIFVSKACKQREQP